ncbi:MAG TPA: hypothetical protein DDZ88_17165 [Verrucomicrobiales bacterium]|nr:hypothetical protein [Verrucomicrobiales bacterium]
MNVYEIITNRIIEKLEQGEIPWKKSWNAQTQAPRNLSSGKLYSGINVFLLLSARYQSPYWLTFKQATERGGSVRKGEKGYPVVFWSKTEKTDEETGEVKEVGFLRYYTVFNVAQIDGLKDIPTIEVHQIQEGAEQFDLAEQIVATMPQRPEIHHGFTRACYSPADDSVSMPTKNAFVGGAEYYSTLFHELAHATGHENRLGRHQTIKNHSFGSQDYSKEELVAEFGSAFLCAEAGVSMAVLDNQAAYIQGWLKALKNDSKLLVTAAAQAQKAADFIMGRKREGGE